MNTSENPMSLELSAAGETLRKAFAEGEVADLGAQSVRAEAVRQILSSNLGGMPVFAFDLRIRRARAVSSKVS